MFSVGNKYPYTHLHDLFLLIMVLNTIFVAFETCCKTVTYKLWHNVKMEIITMIACWSVLSWFYYSFYPNGFLQNELELVFIGASPLLIAEVLYIILLLRHQTRKEGNKVYKDCHSLFLQLLKALISVASTLIALRCMCLQKEYEGTEVMIYFIIMFINIAYILFATIISLFSIKLSKKLIVRLLSSVICWISLCLIYYGLFSAPIKEKELSLIAVSISPIIVIDFLDIFISCFYNIYFVRKCIH